MKNQLMLYGVSMATNDDIHISMRTRRTAYKEAQAAYDKIYEAAIGCKDGTELYTLVEKKGWSLTCKSVETCIKFLEACKVFTYDFEKYYNEVSLYKMIIPDKDFVTGSRYGMFDYELTCLETAIGDIIGDRDSAKELNEYRKASRGKVVGGGFGVSGAVKGMATAGAINMTTGAVHSVVNLFANAAANSKCRTQLKGLVNEERAKRLAMGIKSDILAIHKNLTKILYIKEYFNENEENAADIMYQKLLKNDYSDEQKKELMGQILLKKPYDVSYLEYAYKNFGLDNGNLDELVRYCFNNKGIDYILEDVIKKEKQEAAVIKVLGDDYQYLYEKYIKNNFYYKNDFYEIFLHDTPMLYLDAVVRYYFDEKNKSEKSAQCYGLTRAWEATKRVNINNLIGFSFNKNEIPLYIVKDADGYVTITTERIIVNKTYITYKDIKDRIKSKDYIPELRTDDYWNQCLVNIIAVCFSYLDIEELKKEIDLDVFHYSSISEVLTFWNICQNDPDTKYLITNKYSDKVNIAKKTYLEKLGYNEEEEIFCFCFDNTLLNSGDKGFTFTSKYIYVNDKGKPVRFPAKRYQVGMKGSFTKSIYFVTEDKKTIDCYSLMNKNLLDRFIDFITSY